MARIGGAAGPAVDRSYSSILNYRCIAASGRLDSVGWGAVVCGVGVGVGVGSEVAWGAMCQWWLAHSGADGGLGRNVRAVAGTFAGAGGACCCWCAMDWLFLCGCCVVGVSVRALCASGGWHICGWVSCRAENDAMRVAVFLGCWCSGGVGCLLCASGGWHIAG